MVIWHFFGEDLRVVRKVKKKREKKQKAFVSRFFYFLGGGATL
jgi:hypothetical protein